MKRFPGLEVLDGVPVVKLSFDAPQNSSTTIPAKKVPTPSTFPYPMASSFISGVEPTLVSNFLLR
jgi:nuclear RNA export factor